MSSYRLPSVWFHYAADIKITEETVCDVFQTLFGEQAVANVDIKKCDDPLTGETFRFINIHFKMIHESNYPDLKLALTFIKQINAGEDFRVNCLGRWFFNVHKYVPEPLNYH